MFTKGTVDKKVKVVCSFLVFTVEWRDKNTIEKNGAKIINLGMRKPVLSDVCYLLVCLYLLI